MLLVAHFDLKTALRTTPVFAIGWTGHRIIKDGSCAMLVFKPNCIQVQEFIE